MIYTPYIWPVLATALLLVAVAVYVQRCHKTRAARPFRWLMALMTGWAVFYALGLAAVALPLKTTWFFLQSLQMFFIPLVSLAFVLETTGQGQWLTRGRLAALLSIPLLSALALLTSRYHGLYLANLRLDLSGPLPLLLYARGPVSILQEIYTFVVLAGCCAVLLFSLNMRRLHPRSTLLMVVGLLIPIVTYFLYRLGLTPVRGFDPTTVSFSLCGLLFVWSMVQFRMFSVSPVARSIVVDSIDDLMIVLDTANHIVDFNLAAQSALNLSPARSLGVTPNTLTAFWRQLFLRYETAWDLNEEARVDTAGGPRYYDLSISTIHDRRGVRQGRLFLLRDITERKHWEAGLRKGKEAAEAAVAERTEALRAANQQLHSELAQRALIEQRYRTLFEGAPNLYVTTRSADGQPVIAEVNQTFLRALGYTRDEVIGRSLADFYSEESRAALLGGAYQSALQGDFREAERQLITKAGRMIWALVSGSQDTDETGQVVGTRAMFIDITQRKQAEQALQRMADQRKRLLDLSMGALATLNLDQAIDRILATMRELLALDLGYLAWVDSKAGLLRPARFTGDPAMIERARSVAFPLGMDELMNEVLETGQAALVNHAERDPRIVRLTPPQPGRAERLILAPVVISNRHMGVFGIVRINRPEFTQEEFELAQLFVAVAAIVIQNARLYSEREKHVEEIERQKNELRAVSQHMQEIQEEERRQLSTELHDRVGQNLTALAINLNYLRNKLPTGGTPALDQWQERMEDMMALLESTTRQVRDVMSDLRPPVLDDFGLVTALRSYGQVIQRRAGLEVLVIGEDPQPRLRGEQEMALYRIAQEAVNNTVKHAGASRIVLEVVYDAETVELTIQDDGCGFSLPPDTRALDGHWGLLTIQERARAAGGRAKITSQPGQGASVRVQVRRE